jgi:hypothetical protein
MRKFAIFIALLAVSAFAQERKATIQVSRPDNPPGLQRCCATKVYDAKGKEFGEMIRWDDRFQSVQLQAWVRYKFADGSDTPLLVAPESISSVQSPGGSVALFTTPDCSGNTMFAMLSWPPLTKRYSMILPVGNPSTLGFAATQAWLWVTDPLPARVSPGATVFHSQWGEQGACVPYPAPGYTLSGTPFGGFWMHREVDLYTKFVRPFWSR